MTAGLRTWIRNSAYIYNSLFKHLQSLFIIKTGEIKIKTVQIKIIKTVQIKN